VLAKTALQARHSIEKLIKQVETMRACNATMARGVVANVKKVVHVLGTFKVTLSVRPFRFVRQKSFEDFLKTLAGIDCSAEQDPPNSVQSAHVDMRAESGVPALSPRLDVKDLSDSIQSAHINLQEDSGVPGSSSRLDSQSQPSVADEVHCASATDVAAEALPSQNIQFEQSLFEANIQQLWLPIPYARQDSFPQTPGTSASQCTKEDRTDATPRCEDADEEADNNVVQESAALGTVGDIAQAEDGRAGKQEQDQIGHKCNNAWSHEDGIDRQSPVEGMFEERRLHRHVWRQQPLTPKLSVDLNERKIEQDQGEGRGEGTELGPSDSEVDQMLNEDPASRHDVNTHSRSTSKTESDAAKQPLAQPVHQCHMRPFPVLLASSPVPISGKWRVSCLTPEHQRVLPEALLKFSQESRPHQEADQCTKPLWMRWQHKRPSLPPLDIESFSVELPAPRSSRNRSRFATLTLQSVDARNSSLICTGASTARATLGGEMPPDRLSRYAARSRIPRDNMVPQTARQ